MTLNDANNTINHQLNVFENGKAIVMIDRYAEHKYVGVHVFIDMGDDHFLGPRAEPSLPHYMVRTVGLFDSERALELAVVVQARFTGRYLGEKNWSSLTQVQKEMVMSRHCLPMEWNDMEFMDAHPRLVLVLFNNQGFDNFFEGPIDAAQKKVISNSIFSGWDNIDLPSVRA